MTLLEKRFYLDRPLLNVTYGYPEGLNPGWITHYQIHPPERFLGIQPAEYVGVIKTYFQNFFHSDKVNLTPTCSLAFLIAVRALIRSSSDEIIIIDATYDSYPYIVESFNAKVVYAKRHADNSVTIGGIKAKYTKHTRAVVMCCPENPLGVVYSRDFFEQVITFCKQRNLTLLVDNCLAELSPFGIDVPVVSRLESSKGLSYMLLGDTGKILGLNGSKLGAIVYSDNWTEPLEAAQSTYFFEYNQYDLYLLAAILSDWRFRTYVETVNSQVASNYTYLRDNLSWKFRISGIEGGSFCLIDIAELGMSDVAYVTMLIEEYSTVLIPMSYFFTRQQMPSTQVRIALARSAEHIRRLAMVLNSSASSYP
jgi:aspartate aminotransferase